MQNNMYYLTNNQKIFFFLVKQNFLNIYELALGKKKVKSFKINDQQIKKLISYHL